MKTKETKDLLKLGKNKALLIGESENGYIGFIEIVNNNKMVPIETIMQRFEIRDNKLYKVSGEEESVTTIPELLENAYVRKVTFITKRILAKYGLEVGFEKLTAFADGNSTYKIRKVNRLGN